MSEIAAIEIDASQLELAARAFRKAPAIAAEEFAGALQEVLLLLERAIKENTPTGVNQGGGLRGATTSALTGVSAGHAIAGKVFNPLSYALPVELGTRPHWPPIAPIEDWVVAKLNVPRDEAPQVAYLIARKISRKGTEGAHMFEQSLSEESDQALQIISAALPRIMARIGEF